MSILRHGAALTLAAGLLAGCSGVEGVTSAAPQPAGVLTTLAPGDPIQDVDLPVLAADDQDAGVVDMGDLGGPAVVNFWATWCSFCVDEMPDFEAVHVELRDRVRFIGVDREDFADRALTFAREIGITYELVEDVDGSFFRAAKGRGMPTTLLVDADGVIRYRHAGPMTAQQLKDLILEHLEIGPIDG